MPIYEYRCTNCGHELEALQKFSDPVLKDCPDCRTESLVKRVSAAGFHLKGSGWYATDFRNGSKPAAKTDKADAKGDAPATSDTKTDTKADTKTEAKTDNAAPAMGCGGNCSCH